MWLRTVREAHARRQVEHGEIVARLRGDSGLRRRESRWCQLGCCGACQCLWIHVDDEDLEAAELRASDEAARLERESCDENYRIDPAQLTLGPVLGKGGNGCVYVASYCGFPVAVKEVFSDLHWGSGGLPAAAATPAQAQAQAGATPGASSIASSAPAPDPDTFAELEAKKELAQNDEFVTEFNNLRRLRHPHVVDLYGAAVVPGGALAGSWRRLLVMELAACSLRDVLRNTSQPAPMGTGLAWARQIAGGLAFIHSRGMIHFDIKPANVLLDMSGNAKICDLGVARATSWQTPSSLTFTNSARVGTPSYMAPELLRADVARIDSAIDVYSFGVLLWEILHREAPHPKQWKAAHLFAQVARKRHRPRVEPDVPPALAELTRWCWHEDPQARPTCEQVEQCLAYLAPQPLPALRSLAPGEPFFLWEPEALCFLADCRLEGAPRNGLVDVAFDDGQPEQRGVDARNLVLGRNLEHALPPHQLDAARILLLGIREVDAQGEADAEAEEAEELNGQDDDETGDGREEQHEQEAAAEDDDDDDDDAGIDDGTDKARPGESAPRKQPQSVPHAVPQAGPQAGRAGPRAEPQAGQQAAPHAAPQAAPQISTTEPPSPSAEL
jgi:serine/threonine protein kinase